VEREELTVLTFSYATTYLWFLNRVLITFYFFKQFTHTDHSSKYVCFFKKKYLMLTKTAFIYLPQYSKNSNTVKYEYNLKYLFYILMFSKYIPVMAKLNI